DCGERHRSRSHRAPGVHRMLRRRSETEGCRASRERPCGKSRMNPAAPPPTFNDFFAAWDLFRDPVFAAMIAGATLGYLGVYIVLRRMVFVSAALSQAAGLGV